MSEVPQYPFGTACNQRTRKVDVRLPGKGNSNSHDARPVHQIISMIKWIWTCRLSIKISLSSQRGRESGWTDSLGGYSGTWLMMKRLPLGPHSWTMPRALQ